MEKQAAVARKFPPVRRSTTTTKKERIHKGKEGIDE